MSWRDRFQDSGKFRDAEFLVERSQGRGGRRTEVHELPQRDLPMVEDLGRRAKRFSLELFTIGEDYDLARDKLIAALDEPGPGVLVHPYHGRMRVAVVDEPSWSDSTREGGMCRFSVTFVEADERDNYPRRSADTAVRVDEAASRLTASSAAAFTEEYDVTGQPGFAVAGIQDEITRVLDPLENALQGAVAPITSLVRKPYELAGAVQDGIARLRGIADSPEQAFQALRALFDAGDDSPSVPATTSTRQQQQRNTDAVQQLVRQTAVAEAARAVSTTEYPTRAQAQSAGDQVSAALDTQMEHVDPATGRPVPDAVYQDLNGLRAAVGEDIRVRAAKMPRLRRYTPPGTVPALALAHRIYGDADRADELVRRNGIAHPGFVPGGEPLEVLDDA